MDQNAWKQRHPQPQANYANGDNQTLKVNLPKLISQNGDMLATFPQLSREEIHCS